MLTRWSTFLNFDIFIHGPHHRFPKAAHGQLPSCFPRSWRLPGRRSFAGLSLLSARGSSHAPLAVEQSGSGRVNVGAEPITHSPEGVIREVEREALTLSSPE